MESTNPQPLRWSWSGCISRPQCSHWSAFDQLRKCRQHSKWVVGFGRGQLTFSFAGIDLKGSLFQPWDVTFFAHFDRNLSFNAVASKKTPIPAPLMAHIQFKLFLMSATDAGRPEGLNSGPCTSLPS